MFRVSKIFILAIFKICIEKMVMFENFLKTKSDQNIHQNAQFKKNLLGWGGMPPNPHFQI